MTAYLRLLERVTKIGQSRSVQPTQTYDSGNT